MTASTDPPTTDSVDLTAPPTAPPTGSTGPTGPTGQSDTPTDPTGPPPSCKDITGMKFQVRVASGYLHINIHT